MINWKIIKHHPNYSISDIGEVKNNKTGKILKPFKGSTKYNRVGLHDNGTEKNYFVHRLVADAFCSNPDNKPCVDHKDGNNDNNAASNLQWCTHLENNRNPITKKRQIENQRISRGHKIKCETTGEVFNSIMDAAEKFNVPKSTLRESIIQNYLVRHKWRFTWL